MKFVVKSDCSGLMLELLFWGPPLLLPIQQSYDSNPLLVVYKRLKTDSTKRVIYARSCSGIIAILGFSEFQLQQVSCV
jgi:hypothetical protein